MQVVVVASRLDPDTGYVGERLEELGARLRPRWRNRPRSLDDAESDADLLLLMSSGWSLYDPAWRAEVEAELALIRRALARGVPIFAVCYGAQLVASVLGAGISACDRPEVGWRSIETDDPLLCPAGPWFEFHRDRWSDAPGVPSIARTEFGPQAFVADRVLALQFHPEIATHTIERWLVAQPERVALSGADPAEVLLRSSALAASAREHCRALVDRFLDHASSALRSSLPT